MSIGFAIAVVDTDGLLLDTTINDHPRTTQPTLVLIMVRLLLRKAMIVPVAICLQLHVVSTVAPTEAMALLVMPSVACAALKCAAAEAGILRGQVP